jgi:hypothetical protein
MKFSEQFSIARTKNDDWFDPILSIDTPLFIDPFGIYAQERDVFQGSHAEIIGFFNSAFQLLAQAHGDRLSSYYQLAVDRLRFPEVQELCLGYTGAGTKGSGAGHGLARDIADAIWEAIQAGMTEITHFEEIAILREGIGADRISDATASILRHTIARYTGEVCRRHKVPTERTRYGRGQYNETTGRWEPLITQLPRNPYNRKPILLVPQDYLAPLPNISPEDFWDYCYVNENEVLRREMSHDITRHVPKATIIALARRRADLRRRYIEFAERRGPQPYDFQHDPRGIVRWYDAAGEYCRSHALSLPIERESDFQSAIERMLHAYKHFVEENEGYRLLWNDNKTSKGEKTCQLLFLGVVKHYCQANNIDVSREPNIGRGPVDFKASKGYSQRVLLEVKLARNTRFWNGLTRQFPTYLKAEEVKDGYFLVIVFSERDLERLSDIQAVVQQVNDANRCHIRVRSVDARPAKPSASKL